MLRLSVSSGDDAFLLGLVRGGIAFGRARALGPRGVQQGHPRRQQITNLGHDELPRAHVARLLLHPDDFLEIRVAPRVLADFGAREWIEQLDASDLHVRCLAAPRRRDNVVVDLARAEHQPRHLLRPRAIAIPQHRAEFAEHEIVEVRWRRSRWKYCAGVVQLATRMLPSAPRARNRSSRALECSGPWPS